MARISPNAISKNPDEAAAIIIVIEFPVLPGFCVIVTDDKDKEDKIDVIVTLLTGGVLSTVVLLVVNGIADEESVLSGDEDSVLSGDEDSVLNGDEESVLNGDVEIIVVVGIER